MDAGLLAVVHDHSGALLPAVLEGVEAVVDQVGHVPVAVDPEEAALLVETESRSIRAIRLLLPAVGQPGGPAPVVIRR